MTPLTHHDVLRLAAPLVRRGRRIDLAGSDRGARRVSFVAERDTLPGGRDVAIVWSARSLDDGAIELMRATAVDDGRIATFAALVDSADDVEGALDTADTLTPARQLLECAGPDGAPGPPALARAALDHVLEPVDPDADPRRGPVGTRLALRGATILAGPLRLRVDASTGAGMPADVRLEHAVAGRALARTELASGARLPWREPAARAAARAVAGRAPGSASGAVASPGAGQATADEAVALLDAVPDDLLAVAAPSWRVLRGVGDHRRSALAGLGRGARRSERVEAGLRALLPVLADYVTDPVAWHERHATRRRRVWLQRLKPVMTLGAIFAVMPVAWLAVERGGMALHPLALGLTPLMMVAIVTMSAREVPVMEIPAWPRAPAPLPLPRRTPSAPPC